MGRMKEQFAEQYEFDPYEAPGQRTAQGAFITIESDGTLIFSKGSRVARVLLRPLQWQLLAVALAKIAREDHKGTIALDCNEKEAVMMSRSSRGLVYMTIGRLGNTMGLDLTARDVDGLREAAHARSIHHPTERLDEHGK